MVPHSAIHRWFFLGRKWSHLYRPFYWSDVHQTLQRSSRDQYQAIPTSFSSIEACLRKSSFLFISVISGAVHYFERWICANPICVGDTKLLQPFSTVLHQIKASKSPSQGGSTLSDSSVIFLGTEMEPPLLAVLLVRRPQNFAEMLHGPIPNDPDLIQLDRSMFAKKFIFVHFGHFRTRTLF